MYGISEKDIEFIDKKIDFQKEYLKKFVTNFNDDDSDYLKSVYSANLNPKKYNAEMQTRVNTIVSNAKEKGLLPVFITLSAPSQYHKYKICKKTGNLIPNSKFANQDYFDVYDIKTKKISKIECNSSLTYCPITKQNQLIDYTEYTPNMVAKKMTDVFNNFTNLSIFTKMKKELGHGLVYFKVQEPHIDGTPHFHALAFIPASWIHIVRKRFYQYFMTDTHRRGDKKGQKIWGVNIGGLGFRYTWYKEKGGAVGYVMKYILKTFKDENSTKVQHSVYWYVKNRIRRFTSSRELVPLSVYRKVRYYFKREFGIDSLKEITRLFKDGYINRYFDNTLITYFYYDTFLDDYIEIILWQKDADLVLDKKLHDNNEIAHDLINKRNQLKTKKEIIEFENQLLNKIIPVNKMTDLNLVNRYQHLNKLKLGSFDMNHFILIHNELVKRDLLKTPLLSFNNDDIDF